MFAKMQDIEIQTVSTQDLIKCFNWNQENFIQHDTQEFIAVFFEAIEKQQQNLFIKDIFQGSNVSFVQCLKCDKESVNQQSYLEIQLIVKDPFQMVYNKSLKHGLQHYLKPEVLEKDNQYNCGDCGKQDAKKGVRFQNLPRVLGIMLNRYKLNYTTFEREKINDKVEFEFVLDMDNYINGYEGIYDKVDETSDKSDFEEVKSFQSQNFVKKKQTVKKKPTTKNTTKKSTASEFIKEQRLKKQQLETEQKKQIDLQQEEVQQDNIQQNNVNNLENSNQNKVEQNIQPPSIPPPPPPIFESEKPKEDSQKLISDPKKDELLLQKQQDKSEKIIPIQTAESLMQQQSIFQLESKKNIQSLISKGKQHIYTLYSILIHSGGAVGGHYYSYTLGQDNIWRRFNDTTVDIISIEEMLQNSFGNYNTSAYMLYYRRHDSIDNKTPIPGKIQDIVKEYKQNQYQIDQANCQSQLDSVNSVVIRVYLKLEVKAIKSKRHLTLNQLKTEAMLVHNLKEKHENVRLRFYRPNRDQMTDTFGGQEEKTLEQLNIISQKTMILEVKKDIDEFIEYNQELMLLNITFWTPDIETIDERFLEKQSIFIKRSALISDLITEIQKNSPYQNVLLIMQRNQYGNILAEAVSLQKYHSSPIDDFQIFENSLIYIEENSSNNDEDTLKQTLKWQTEFENQNYRLTIKYNNPKSDQIEQIENKIIFDSRKSLSELKKGICFKCELDENKVILKRGRKNGVELKKFNATLQSLNFTNGTFIYLEIGNPTNEKQFRVILSIANQNDLQVDNYFHNFTEIGEFVLDGDRKPSQIKQNIAEFIKNTVQLDIQYELIRLRERFNDRVSKIYKEISMKEQAVTEKKSISIEILQQKEELSKHEYMVYFRFWDQSNWKLSDRFELILSQNTNIFELQQQILSKNLALTALTDLTLENMEIKRIQSIWSFNRYDLLSQGWVDMYTNQKLLISSNPLHIQNDGFLFINQEVQELTEQQIKAMGVIKAVKNNKPYQQSHNQKEQSLQINVITQEEALKQQEKTN